MSRHPGGHRHGHVGHGIAAGGTVSRGLAALMQLAGLAFLVDVLSGLVGGK